jgi:4-amino-4-deoxy-L-arabinose transferase-like glycosyltransferase
MTKISFWIWSVAATSEMLQDNCGTENSEPHLLKSTTPIFNETRQQGTMLFLTFCAFFILLGSRALNEPDEGRYAEIGREMIETGDWLTPHFWYLPHFDKPPLTYWLVAVSMKLFGQNEWAVRLPLALAGFSGAGAAWCWGASLGGRRVAVWSVLILQTSLLYFAMARMLTTDIFLTQFDAWAVYCFWRSWLCLRVTTISSKCFWPWHLAGWLAIALGFLTKGPIALAIPLVTMFLLAVFRWKTLPRKKLLFAGCVGGAVAFFAVAAPWFLAANVRVPHTLDYMIFHQAAGHVLGTTIRTRNGFPFYFFVILTVGLLPWTWLLGWLWRRAHWHALPEMEKDGWLMLNVWAAFTFTLFSVTHSKLPAYILPILPAMAVLLAWRFFGGRKKSDVIFPPRLIWLCCALSPLFLLAAFPLALPRLFHVTLPGWMHWQTLAMVAIAAAMFALARKWSVSSRAMLTVGIAIGSMLIIAREASWFEVDFKANQTLKPFGRLLRENYRAGDAVLCWGQLPAGLPFYSEGVICATNRPYFGGMNLTRVPFEFPGNRQRLGELLLPDDGVVQLLSGNRRVLVIIDEKTSERFRKVTAGIPLHAVGKSGLWELFSNR